MRIFAIDTALEACSAAVFDTEQDALVAREDIAMARGHAEALMPLISRVIDKSGGDFGNIDRFAVTSGPGSFTGLRVGIAAARGLALAAGKPVVGLSTLAAFAAPLLAADNTSPVAVAIDARHDHVYFELLAGSGHVLVSPRVVPLTEAAQLSAGSKTRLTGNAADLLAAARRGAAPAAVEQHAAPDITWVARLGATAVEAASPPKPFYLRAPDAQPSSGAHLARR